jgi:pilus assembly protein CpaB
MSIALASGGLAASQVHERERRAAEAVGPSVEVLVAARDLRAGARVTRDAVAVKRVPVRFAPPDAFGSAAAVLGASTSAPVASGGYLTAAVFEGTQGRQSGNGLRRNEREVTVAVAGGGAIAELAPGSRVDVLVSTETGTSGGHTSMALAGGELLRVAEAVGGGEYGESSGRAGPTALATLRVTLRQAIYLTAADNFAREIRLLPRPPGDRSRAGGSVSQGQL